MADFPLLTCPACGRVFLRQYPRQLFCEYRCGKFYRYRTVYHPSKDFVFVHEHVRGDHLIAAHLRSLPTEVLG